MPWSHRLPDYAHLCPAYGQNLVELAALLAPSDSAEHLQVIDVGANIGDSTKQIVNRVRAQVLAVEADPYYLGYLRRNVGDLPDVEIAPVLLTTDSTVDLQWAPTRRGGTTHFREMGDAVPGGEVSGQPDLQSTATIRVGGLPSAYPDFANVRLIKSDTDGHDTELVPELAAAYRATRPVLYFEYDPALTSAVAGADATQVWASLASLGYDRVGLWGNDGIRIRQVAIDEVAQAAADALVDSRTRVGYLDAVAVHADDAPGHAALAHLFS